MDTLLKLGQEAKLSQSGSIAKLSYKHEYIIDIILANPTVTAKEIGVQLGYSENWIRRVISSDAFQARVAERKGELIDPLITATMEEKLRMVAQKSMDVVLDKLTAAPGSIPFGDIVKAMEVSSKALGYGASTINMKQTNVQQNVVVVPPTETNSADWARKYSPIIEGEADASPT